MSGIFSVLIHENKLFCQIQYCASPAQSMPKTGLRAKRRFLRSARKTQPRLRAKWRFLGFARKTQPSVTGKTPISGICPQMLDPVPPKVDKNNALLSIFAYHRLKIRLPHPRNPKRNKQCFPRSSARCNATTSHQPALHFQCKKAESPLHPRKFRIDHPNVPYLTTITEQGAF